MSNTVIYGLFENELWRDEKNGASFFLLKTKHNLFMSAMYSNTIVKRNKYTGIEENWYTITVDASNISTPAYNKKTPIKISGYFSPQNDGIWKFVAVEVSESSNDKEITINYLLSETFPDISLEDAEKIVNEIGTDIHQFIISEKSACTKIMKITGLDRKAVYNVIRVIEETNTEKHTYSLLSKAEIPYPYCVKAVKLYGKKAPDKLKKEPYKAGSKIGLSFIQCDRLAKIFGNNAFDSGRLRLACSETMDMFAAQGHTYTPLSIFKKAVTKKLENGIFPEKVAAINVVNMMNGQYELNRIDGITCIYSKKLLEAEKRIAKNIKRLSCGTKEPYYDGLIDYASKACNIKYGKQQRQAFTTILSRRGVKIITGGPGTGKTTTIKGILLAYREIHPDHIIKLCAPAGRASQRVAESTGMAASTIHRLLDYKPYGESVSCKNMNDPVKADLIVIDEVSMADIILFDMLLEATKTGTTVIIVGDIHQLESVGPGAVLHDLLTSEDTLIQKCLLTEVFRQKCDSPIIDNSEKINNGDIYLNECDDFQIITTKSEEESLEKIIELSREYYKSDNPFETQILCPARSGMTGIDNLNKELHNILNHKEKTLVYGKQSFCVNDKILMTKNNLSVDYYNGDIGIVKEVVEHGLIVEIRGNEIHLTREMLDDIKLSYSMTIHKSQGSEFYNVIVVMPMEPKNMLVRNLFYTGVTRAKKKVIVINESSAMQTAIKTDKSGCRRTLLSRFLPAV